MFEVQFITLEGGLGRIPAGNDAVSGLVYPAASLPTNFSAKTVVVYSLQEAEAHGIKSDGTSPLFAELHFHVSSFYKQVTAPLYITISAGDLAADVRDLQNEASGAIRQVAVLSNSAALDVAVGVATLNTVAEQLEAEHKGLSVLFVPKFDSADNISNLPAVNTGSHPYVSVLVGADAVTGYSSLGATLGVLANSKVSECIAYVKKGDVAKGAEFNTLAFTTGESYKTKTETELDALSAKGYIFLRKYTGFTGSFHSDSPTATLVTSDLAKIENVRTLEKAKRAVRLALVPELGSPLKTKGGLLTQDTIARFDLLCRNILDSMVTAGELTDFQIDIDDTQNVLSTSTLTIKLGLTPLGVARSIVVPIGFQAKATA